MASRDLHGPHVAALVYKAVIFAASTKITTVGGSKRKLTQYERDLAANLFSEVAALRIGESRNITRSDILSRFRALAPVAALSPRHNRSEAARESFVDYALSNMREIIPQWGLIAVDGAEVEVAFEKVDPDGKGLDVAWIKTLRMGDLECHSIDETTTVGDAVRSARSWLDLIAQLWPIYRKCRVLLLILSLLGLGYTVDRAAGGHVLQAIKKAFSWVSHRPPTPPLRLPQGLMIEESPRPTGIPTQTLPFEMSCCDSILTWQLSGSELIAATSQDRLRYVRRSPDSDLVWTWEVSVDGVPLTYESAAQAIRIRGPHLGTIKFQKIEMKESSTRAFELAAYDGRGVRVVTDGTVSAPADAYADNGLLLRHKPSEGTSIEPDRRVFGRERWRPPLLDYTCDGRLECTFTLSVGPFLPCWQRVEVDCGDGTVLETRQPVPQSQGSRVLPSAALMLIPGPPLRDDWDASMVRVIHQYARPGVYPVAFGLRPADSQGYRGPCTPSPPISPPERWRWVTENLAIGSRVHGRLPDKSGLSEREGQP